jgi:hypothetical protein
MLFDLRGRGRRRTVQVIYLSLAILMGGGLILFGIGSATGQGGLLDAFTGGGTSAQDQAEERVDEARTATESNPRDANAWARLAQEQYSLAGASEGFDETTGTFSGEAREHLQEARASWNRSLQLVGEDGRPNADVAAVMRNALSSLEDNAGAVRAQEIVIDSLPDPGYGDFATLAQLAFLANQTRKGDLAADRAVELAPKDQRSSLKTQLEQLKNQISAQRAQEALGQGGGGG